MGDGQGNSVTLAVSSTGLLGTGAGWLDVHFEACRPEYEAMVRSVGIQPGWRVLDAGCGGGAFLPLLAELVGPTGAITALDIAPDNAAKIERGVAGGAFPAPIEARVGSILALPYADASFDAVWCANVVGYLTDEELAIALAEFRRVVRPGGVIGIKEHDGTMQRILPAPPFAISHLMELEARRGVIRAIGCVRTPSLAAMMRSAGLTNVWSRTILAERSAPLRLPERQFWGAILVYWVPIAQEHPLSTEDRAFWERMSDPIERERWLDDPDLTCCEGQIIAVGTVP